ncbi:M20 family metallopeptidase [Bacillus swezeyi]|uniref:M20 metallopeptidase family protein n=1 Tax=Bacillus swezeyi TaxID=1925020 RepID=UPI0039C70D01
MLVSIRRELHQNPEMAFREVETAEVILNYLKSWGIETISNVAGTGVIGIINGEIQKPVIGLRADMDALPIQDKKDVEYKSKVANVMHACGHDAHVTMLLGAAYILSKYKDKINVKIKLIFQPAEEGPGGAKPLIQTGYIDDLDIIFAQHVDPFLDVGTIGIQNDKAMAAIDKFNLKFIGKGGHGAYPHQTVDPIVVASQTIMAFQTVISRMINPLDQGVITIGTINGGSKRNVIAEEVTLGGTIRTFCPNTRNEIHQNVTRIVESISGAYGTTHQLDYELGYDPLINNKYAIDILKHTVSDLNRVQKFETLEPVMSSEDFGYYLSKFRGCLWWIGAKPNTPYPLHSPHFDINEDVLPLGVEMMVKITIKWANLIKS